MKGAVPDVIADHFERNISVDQTLHTGVAQRMRSGSSHVDAGLVQIAADALRNGSGAERSDRYQQAKEQMPVSGSRATLLQVNHQRLADDVGQVGTLQCPALRSGTHSRSSDQSRSSRVSAATSCARSP